MGEWLSKFEIRTENTNAFLFLDNAAVHLDKLQFINMKQFLKITGFPTFITSLPIFGSEWIKKNIKTIVYNNLVQYQQKIDMEYYHICSENIPVCLQLFYKNGLS